MRVTESLHTVDMAREEAHDGAADRNWSRPAALRTDQYSFYANVTGELLSDLHNIASACAVWRIKCQNNRDSRERYTFASRKTLRSRTSPASSAGSAGCAAVRHVA